MGTKINHGFIVEAHILDETNKKMYDLSEQITSIMVRKTFIGQMFPLYVVNFLTTVSIRDRIRDDDVKLYLKIEYYNLNDYNNSIESRDDNEIVPIGKVFDGYIRIYDKPFTTTTTKLEDENSSERATQNDSIPFIPYRISGIPEAAIEKNEETVNAVYKNATLLDSVVHMISSVTNDQDIYIQNLRNTNTHENVLVPPLALGPAIHFLDEAYHGLYDNELQFFIDANAIYLYDALSKDAPTTNKISYRILPAEQATNTENTALPEISDTTGQIEIKSPTIPAFTRNEKIATHELGSHTVVYYYDANFNLVARTRENDESYEKSRYLWNKISDKTFEELDRDKAISIPLSNINPEIINPLTIIDLQSTEYQIIAGEYAIAELSYIMQSNDKIHFTDTVLMSAVKR